ncbi:MAG: EamA family transporter, partial [Ignavibacteriaceae bacterium]
MKAAGLKIALVYVLLCFIWGSTWLAIRIGLESMPPIYSAGMRFTVASIFIFILMQFRGIKLQKDKISIRLYLVMGFFSFVIPFGLVYWAEQFVPSGLASVLFAVYPFFVVIFSYFSISKDSIDIYKIIGVILGFGGLVTIFSDSFGGNITDYLLGMIAIVISGIMQAEIAVLIKKYGHHLNPLSMNFIPMLIAGISMLVIGLMLENITTFSLKLNAAISILYLGFFGSVVTFTSYYWLLKRINIVILALIAFITPIVALILGYFFYNEDLSMRHFIGSLLVLIGLLSANFG